MKPNMIFSREFEIVIKAMAYLASQPVDVPQPPRAIASKCECSENTLTQLFHPLAQVGLLQVQRGRQGGFCLSRPLDQMTVSEVVEALGGQKRTSHCSYPNQR